MEATTFWLEPVAYCRSIGSRVQSVGAGMLDLSHIHNASNTVSLLHDLEGTVDLGQWLPMCDEFINLQFSGHVVVNQIGKLGAPLYTTESATFPYTAGDELECFVILISTFLTDG